VPLTRSLLLVALLAATAEAKPKHTAGAVAILIDRSGSMQGPKLDRAKAAALAAVDALDPTDLVEIVAFDSDASVIVPITPAAKRADIAKQLEPLKAGGGTAILPALQLAFDALRDAKGPRHVVLLTDGEAPSDGIDDLAKRMHAAKITTSAIGVQGADRNLLSMIADATDGRLYMVDDMATLKSVFAADVKRFLP